MQGNDHRDLGTVTGARAADHPASRALLDYFATGHLPGHLAAVSDPCGELATRMAASLPPSAEVTTGLRKLLEAKDCFVRAAVTARKDGAL